MRVLAFRHVPFEDVGRIGPVLKERGIALEYADLYQAGAKAPDPSAFHGLIFMGGPMSVNDGLPFLECEMRVISEAVKRNQPVLGICLGAQLMAKALGSRVFANAEKEIGWFDVSLSNAGIGDPLFAGFPQTTPVFHWHGETFDLPPQAVLLASSARCAHQAYRIGEWAYGLQFHLEVSPEMIADWCTQDCNCGDVQELEDSLDSQFHAKEMSELSENLFGRWCDLLGRSQYLPSDR